MELAERGHKKMEPEKVKDMIAAGGKNRDREHGFTVIELAIVMVIIGLLAKVRAFIKSGKMKKLINSLPPTIVSSFTGTRGKNILYLNPPGINLTVPFIEPVRRCEVSAGRCGIGSGIVMTAFSGMVQCQNARLWTGRES